MLEKEKQVAEDSAFAEANAHNKKVQEDMDNKAAQKRASEEERARVESHEAGKHKQLKPCTPLG